MKNESKKSIKWLKGYSSIFMTEQSTRKKMSTFQQNVYYTGGTVIRTN